MLLKREVIAKKYAQALLSLYYEKFDNQSLADLLTLEKFFKKNKKISVYLSIPTISESSKQKALETMLDHFEAGNLIKKIAFALLKHRRIELLDKVLHHIIHQLYLKKNILLFEITTSRSLTALEQTEIINFVQKKTGASIEANFLIDKELISGICIKGDYFLWERSLARLLQNIKLPFIQRARS